MTSDKIITIAKEKLGKDITEQEAQDYLDGKLVLPDEALEIVGGGASCAPLRCPNCDSDNITVNDFFSKCKKCGSFV